MSDDQFGPMLADMSDEAFWDDSHQWDLLHTLSARWNGLSDEISVEIETRLLKGCANVRAGNKKKKRISRNNVRCQY